MRCKTFMLWFLFSLFSQLTICLDQASFYGSSYISLPFEEAKSSTDIQFKFRTLLPSALILLVAGATDYCIVQLENSRIKININLGAGESELFSPHNFKLNDFKWHQVTITRKDANLSLIIDNTHKTQKHLPGRFFELNIHYGLFIGGHGNFSEIFFGHLDSFRGCISEMSYNGIRVLEQARSRQLQSLVQRITWNCAAEFEAPSDQPVSFVEDDAFMSLSQPMRSKEYFKVQFESKTISDQGLLFYNSGNGLKLDFFLIEIHKGNIRTIVKSGAKSFEIHHNVPVSDGEWHKIQIRATSSILEVIVDGKIARQTNNHAYIFQLSDYFYFGGLEMSKRSRAMSKGCKFCDVSFKGCLRHITVQDKLKGLPDVHVSEGLLPGCVWEYPCLQNPCKNDANCIQQGLNSFQCKCKEEFCIKPNYTEGYKVFSRNSLATELELLSVDPLEVLEGESVIITSDNLHMILDYQKYGIKETGIRFYIVESPSHGSVTSDIWTHEENSFLLSDITRDKVFYIHDGSEYHQDTIILEVEFSTDSKFILPAYLQGRFRFSLTINVIPVNDPPKLSEETVLRLVQGSEIVVDGELFKIVDPDSVPEQVVFTILHSEVGHFEKKGKPRVGIISFTQQELEKRSILFVHNQHNEISAKNDSYISLQVSDGIETSSVIKIRVSVSPQYWRLENNTGLIILHQTATVITPFNLSFISNTASDHKIQFQIVKKPKYGVIELERRLNHWESTETFTNIDLNQHRVRYRHTNSKPDFDEFQFKLTVNKSGIYTFRLTFAKCSLHDVNVKPLEMNGSWESTISTDYLSFRTAPIKAPTTSIHYVILNPPEYGFLFFSQSKYRLKSCDLFTQEDLISHNIKFKFIQKPFSIINDSFTFVALSPGCNNVTGSIHIIYNPTKEAQSKVSYVKKVLKVEEGTAEILDSTHLRLESEAARDMIFNITKMPHCGLVQVVNKSEIVRNNTNYFTLHELKSKQIWYKHDGTESEHDVFKFMGLSINDDFEFVGDFEIDIILKNDNSPLRTVNKIFHVVVGGERLLTKDDLSYTDLDLYTKSSDIVYTCRESPNGNFYFYGNYSAKITEFTQDDLDNGRVLFKHKGPEFGKVRLWVTDGQFHVSGILEIQASAPFIHIHTRKKLLVEQRNIALITRDHLSHSTNVFCTDSEVIYEIVNQPNCGKVVSTYNLKWLTNFTQHDVNQGLINYLNDVSSVNADEIGLQVKCKDALNVAQLGVWILPSSYWEPFQIKNTNKLIVEETTSVIITKNELEVSQPNVPSSAITYYLNQPPEFGYISVLSDSKDYEPTNVLSFTQDLINENRVIYIQSSANQTRDKFRLNITNGMIWHNNLEFRVEIIPEQIYLGSNQIVVNEGGSVTLSNSYIFVLTDYYKNKIKDYVIVKDAKFGCIQVHKRCNKLGIFSQKELTAGVVSYVHDGSENLQDSVEFSVISNHKRSKSVVLSIKILPVNDQKPKLVNNTGLIMWEGGEETISNFMLAAIDGDLPGDALKYQVLNCWWGSVSLKSDISNPANHFTQELIDKGLIVFRHQNGSEAQFSFNISDGLHTTKEYTFHIRTKPVILAITSRSLNIFPLQKKYLTSSHLLATISDPSRNIIYEVTKPPSLGRLMMESESRGIFKIVSKFTQSDLNNSRVFYEHTHQFSDLYANDSFVYDVKAHIAKPLSNQVLKIDISVSSGGLDAYVSIPKIVVNEGGTTNVPLNISGVVTFLENHSGLRSPIIHASALPALHGSIYLQNHKNVTGAFTQQQLESGQVYYEHDHSDSLGDNIYFSLYLIPDLIPLCNLTVPIIVNPINDQPFNLVTPAPSLTVVQGENHTITREELATEDADTPPSKIKYDLISGPNQGKLVLLPDKIPVNYFTQADIDNNLLVYVHNSSVLKDSYHFRVWDEKFRPQFTLFNILVIPVNFSINSGLPVYLQQGSDVAFLSEQQFFIQTNVNKDKVRYFVKKEPKHGVLYVGENSSRIFTQLDLKNDNVMYLQTDMTTANDSFKVFAEIASGNTSIGSEIDVIIKVQPLMQMKNLTVVTGTYNKITLDILDATPLAKLTNSNPKFTILDSPKFIDVRKVIRSSGEKRNVLNSVVNSFTHEEVQSGLIFLACKDFDVPWNGVNEKLLFLLAASIFQPAIGELKINVRSSLNNELYSTLAGPSDPAGHEGGLHFASPNMTRDYFLIVSMVVGVVILGVAVIVIIKCRSLETEELNKQDQCLQPIPLPRPPDRLLASPPPSKHPNLGGLTTSTALPQCKVTPLGRNEDVHACYPYGTDEHPDDWSSCDASDPSCPTKNIMLRRNQYWV